MERGTWRRFLYTFLKLLHSFFKTSPFLSFFSDRPTRETILVIISLFTLMLIGLAAAQSASISFANPTIRITEGGVAVVRVQKTGDSATAVGVRVRVSWWNSKCCILWVHSISFAELTPVCSTRWPPGWANFLPPLTPMYLGTADWNYFHCVHYFQNFLSIHKRIVKLNCNVNCICIPYLTFLLGRKTYIHGGVPVWPMGTIY